jgi:hypothetical protein
MISGRDQPRAPRYALERPSCALRRLDARSKRCEPKGIRRCGNSQRP